MLLMVIVLLVGLIAGCASGTPASPQVETTAKQQSSTTTVEAPYVETMSIKLYYASQDASSLVPEIHVVPKTIHPAHDAMVLLLREPHNPQLVKMFPEGVQLRGLVIKDHIAFVDFSDKLIKNNHGGSTTESLMVGSIVNTLTEFPEIHKVQILVEGKKVATISGHLDVSEPLGRSEI
jgi:spore germination protein GerM